MTSTKHTVIQRNFLVAVLSGGLGVGTAAQAAQCLTATITDKTGEMITLQLLEPKQGPKKLISDKGFERTNCKELGAKSQAYADKACAASEAMPPEIERLVAADIGFSPKDLCSMSKEAVKEAKAAEKLSKPKN